MEEQLARDDQLVDRIRSADRDALGELYDRYASAALATALRVVADRAAAEDVTNTRAPESWRM